MNKKIAEPSAMIEISVNFSDHAESRTVSENEVLCACPIACLVADGWAANPIRDCAPFNEGSFFDALEKITVATRNSPLRKVKS